MKKLTAIVLVLLLSMFCVTAALADTVYTEGTLYYTVGEGCVTITGYFGKESEVYVPNMIAGLPVSVIARGAFVGTRAAVVYLPDTVMEVQEGAIGQGVKVVFNYNTEQALSFDPVDTEPVKEKEAVVIVPEPAPDASQSTASGETTGSASQEESAGVNVSLSEIGEETVEDTLTDDPAPVPEPSDEPVAQPALALAPESATEPEAPAAPTAPSVQEKSNSNLWVLLCAALAVAAVALVFYFRKKKSTDESEKG